MSIEIRTANWESDRAQLSAIRRQVFIEEQAVPEHLELDAEDSEARHWLALWNGEPAGTVRLLRSGQIGRMAVLQPARRRGIGAALLQAAIDAARSDDWREVYLHAQHHAIEFYAARGFVAEGPEFMDAGINHRSMRLTLRNARILGSDGGRFAARDLRAGVQDLTTQCQRKLRILFDSLDHHLFDTVEFTDALSRLARRSRFSEVRLLLVDSRPLVQRGHRVLELQRRLSSAISLRKVSCEPEHIVDNYLIADDLGILCVPLKEPERAWGDYNNRPVAEDYASRFDELWNRASEDPELRLLNDL